MGSRRKGRILAVQALYAWEMSQDEQLELLSSDGTESSEDGLQSNVFAQLLVQGTVKNVESIDEAIKKRLQHWDITRIARVDLAILRMSVYCLLYQPDLPASVVINEAVDIAKNFGSEQSFRFINGVLDAVAKGRDT
ncbi:MAG: transcription antitermination factor NusB [Spirochaetaceae bacterium]|nr:MAG: transcription antitermination factor NusB [Spirochaetaceae bacterium]